MKNICLFAFLLVIAASLQDCQPYGTRLAFGSHYHGPLSSQLLSVWFNTRDKCGDSFALIRKQDQSFSLNKCSSLKVAYSTFSTYVHRCSLQQIEKGKVFQYMTFGASDDEAPMPNQREYFVSRVPSDEQEINFINIADWGQIVKMKDRYKPLTSSFDFLLRENSEIDFLFINGDIAYDIDSNNGANYENFLRMLSQVSPHWPIVFSVGNHQQKTQNDIYLYSNTFQLYGLMENNVTSLRFKQFSLLLLNPYEIIYHNNPLETLLKKLRQELSILSLYRRPIIAASHYPVTCSGDQDPKHCNVKELVSGLFEELIDYRVVLYMGGHEHTYEREYPYLGKNIFAVGLQPPYRMTRNSEFLVSIVQGLAGTDTGIVQDVKKVQDYTANLKYGQTGYGIVGITDSKVQYSHYTTSDTSSPFQSFTIDYQDLFSSSQLRIE